MSDDDASLANISKIQRIEQHGHGISQTHQGIQSTSPHQRLSNNNDFSGSVKRKLADSKRTGQACDRCKVCTDPSRIAPNCAVQAPLRLLRARARNTRDGQKGSAVARSALQGGSVSRSRRRPRLRPTARRQLQQHHNHHHHILTHRRSGRYAAMAVPRDARPASRTAPNAAPPTASLARPPSAAMPRPWRARTHTCAPTWPTCRPS